MALNENSQGRELKLSRHVYFFEKDGFVALYHALNMNKVYGSRELSEMYNALISPTEETLLIDRFGNIIDTLARKGMIVEGGDGEDTYVEELRENVGKIEVTNLVLLVSNNCNFKCSYCQIEENIDAKHRINMTETTAQKALDLFELNANPGARKTITITGGEPLLNFDLVSYIVKRVRDRLADSRIVLFTNGSLITEEHACFFRKNDVLVLVSIDGPAPIHDAVRQFKDGRESFDCVIRGYEMLRDAGCKVGISGVSGKHNNSNVDDVIRLFLDLRPSSVGFNIPHYLYHKENPIYAPLSDFCNMITRIYESLRAHGIFLENISRSIDCFAHNKLRLNECQAQGRGFTVDARGKVGPCKSLVVTDIYSKNIKDLSLIKEDVMFKEWARRSPIMEAGCLDCPAIAICGGGCAYDSQAIPGGHFMAPDKRICIYQKDMLNYLIWDLFKNLKDKVIASKIYFPTVDEQLQAFKRYYDVSNGLQRSVGHESE